MNEKDYVQHEEIEKTAFEGIDCETGIHAYPDQDFEVGPRMCDWCGTNEY